MTDDEESKVTQYLVPANVSTRFEFFPGLGWRELLIIVIALVVGLFLFLGLGLPQKTIYVNSYGVQVKTATLPDSPSKQASATPKPVPILPPLIRVFAIIVPGAGSFFLVRRDPTTNISLMELLKSSRSFRSKQARYLYRYGSGSEV